MWRRSALAVVDPTTVKLNRLARFVQQREHHTAAQVFVTAFAQDADGFQPIADFRSRFDLLVRQPQPQRPIDEADFERVNRFAIGDPARLQIVERLR